MADTHPIKAGQNLTMAEILRRWPAAGPALLSLGLACMGCPLATLCTIEAAAKDHGVDQWQIRKVLLEACSP